MRKSYTKTFYNIDAYDSRLKRWVRGVADDIPRIRQAHLLVKYFLQVNNISKVRIIKVQSQISETIEELFVNREVS